MKNQDLTKADLLEKLSQYERRITELEDLKEEYERSEKALQLALSELDRVFNTAADGMWVIDKEFNVLRMNAALCELSGYNKNEVVGKKCHEVFRGPLCHTSDCTLLQILDGEEKVECEVEKLDCSGNKIPCIIAATPWRDSNGRIIGVVEDYKDISAWKEMENRLLTYQNKLEQLVEDRVIDIEETNKRLIIEID
ncbi:MAG: PAS domain-containing protein, partial [Deltaproteobacteria bacterium]|nr:PAS domain-containing protein [Deltaproteobacteria bacterium]